MWSCRRYIATWLLIFLAGPGQVAAEPIPALTNLPLIEAIEQALVQYPSMGVADAEFDRARAARGEAIAGWFPSLSFSAGATRYEEQMPATPIHGFSPGTLPAFNDAVAQYGFHVGYTLFDGGRRRGRIRRAQSWLGAAESSRNETRQYLIASVIITYLSVLSGREILAAHDHRLAALRAELSRAEQFFDQERAAKVEILRVQAGLASAEADREQARTGLDVAEKNLASLLGVAPENTSAPRLIPLSLSDTTKVAEASLYSAALISNSTVEQTRRRVTAARAELTVARGARWPALQLGGNWIDQGDFDGHRVDEWNVSAAFSLPIFSGGAIGNRITQARATLKAAEERTRLAELALQREIDQTLARLNEAQSRINSLSRAVESFAEVARIEKLLVKTGSGTQTAYLDAEADLMTARATLVNARHAEIAARVELARLTGELDLPWVSRHLENQP
ncbi:TolC family protein [Candidatus Zixiibacteriota bacterium]